MNILTSLSCPSCGASVRVNVNSKTGICEYCKNEFICQNALNAPKHEDYQKYQNEKQLQGDDW